jgi:hypothetical protein
LLSYPPQGLRPPQAGIIRLCCCHGCCQALSGWRRFYMW